LTWISFGQGAKSLIIIGYQLISEHVRSCQKWHSYKANAILNSLEIVFWAAVCFLTIQANIQSCLGNACIMSWIVMGIAIGLS
jgi:hypothetical protein